MHSLGLIVGVGNTLQHLEFKGPPTYEDWVVFWMVFEAAMFMVKAVRPPWLEAHRMKVLFYRTDHGAKCWQLLYHQESRRRSGRLPWMLMRKSDKAAAAIAKDQHTSLDL